MGCTVSYMADEKKRLRGHEIGPTGQCVARNLRRLRGTTSLRELQDKLREVGHEISASGLQKIEAGARRVDVDDLLALAVALDVNPTALLFPRTDSEPLEVTGARFKDFRDVWEWAMGQNSLGGDRRNYDLDYFTKIRPMQFTNPKPLMTTAGYDELEERLQSLIQDMNQLRGKIAPNGDD